MKTLKQLSLGIALCASTMASAQARIAVTPLASPFKSSYQMSAFGGQVGAAEFASFGPTLSDLLAGQLIAKRFAVVERANIDKLLEEATRQDTGAFNEATAVEVGKLALANLAIVGSVNDFSFTSRQHSVLGIRGTESTGKVGIMLRLVRISDGEAIDSFTDSVSVTSVDVNLGSISDVFGSKRSRGGWGSTQDRAATWGSLPLISNAARKLVEKAVAKFAPSIEAFSKNMSAADQAIGNSIEAKVLDLTGNEAVVELNPNFKKGDPVIISVCESEVKNDAGKVIKRKMKQVGTGTITAVETAGGFTIQILTGLSSLKKGDKVTIEKAAR